jgi:PAS domain S-box-containing protein
MAAPVEVSPGLLVDGRNVVMAFSGAIGGPLSAAITAAILAAMRVLTGGAGTVAGVAGIVVVGMASSCLWIWLRAKSTNRFTPTDVTILAVMAAILPPLALYLISPPPWPIFLDALVLVVPTNFVGVLLLGFLIIADRERRWALTAYSESQARLQAITNNAPAVLFQLCLSPEGRGAFRYVSGGSERILGTPADVLVRSPEAIVRMMSREALNEVEALLARSAADGKAWDLETEFTRPNGSTLWMRAAAEPRVDLNGELVWDGSLFDITEQKRSEQMKNDFVSTVSHELRTPLTSIRGSLGLVAAGVAGPLPEKAAGLIKIAHSNSERLVRLINDILDIEKIESGRMPFDVRPMALAPLVQQSMEASNGYLAEHEVKLALVDDAPEAIAIVDPDRLHQVMLNLLSNAIKYSPAQSSIKVHLRRMEGTVRISVTDHGPGIPEEFRSRIFGKFEQADSSDTRERGGTGLGLSIVKAITERLNGAVSFETTLGAGTTFHVDLPEVVQEPPAAQDTVMAQKPDGSQPRVLICEDDHETAQVIAAALNQKGMVSDVAPDMDTARSLLAGNIYMAMTLDLGLTGESGIILYRELRSMQASADLPVIVISAVADEARKTLNGAAVGIIDWLEKPIDMPRLYAAIAKIGHQMAERKPAILHVEDDEDVLKVISASLGDDVAVTPARSAAEARRMLREERFDLVILDLGLPDGSGADLISVIPLGTAVVIFSALEVDEALAARVTTALTKTKTSEIAIADLVKSLIVAAPLPGGTSAENASGR